VLEPNAELVFLQYPQLLKLSGYQLQGVELARPSLLLVHLRLLLLVNHKQMFAPRLSGRLVAPSLAVAACPSGAAPAKRPLCGACGARRSATRSAALPRG
jgi:hypothetical protein